MVVGAHAFEGGVDGGRERRAHGCGCSGSHGGGLEW